MYRIYLWQNIYVTKLFPGVTPSNPDPRTTDDHFLMEIGVHDNEKELADLLWETGAVEVKVTEKES